jgi:chitinase
MDKNLYRLWRAAFVILFALVTCTPTSFALEARHEKILAGFLEEWSIYYADYNIANLQNNGVADSLSHLIYAFANVTASPAPACALADPWADYQTPYLPSVNGTQYTSWPYGNFGAMIQLKQLHPNLKVLISLGGASAANTAAFSADASTAAGRQALAASCINMFIQGNVGTDWSGNPVSTGSLFDGIHIDWEFPTAADRQNFTALLDEFRKQLDALGAHTGRHYILSFDGPAGSENYTNIQLARAAEAVDFITIDGYNYAGSWDTVTNDASSLFDSEQDPEFGQGLDIDATVDAYLKAGVPPSKYVMGLPLYGVGWTGVAEVNHGLYESSTGPSAVLLANGTGECPDLSGATPGCDTLLTAGLLTYSTLSTLTSNGYSLHFDPKRVAVSLYNPATETFFSFDNPFTATLKMAYVQLKAPGGLGGAFVWALKDDDANGTMVKTMAAGLKAAPWLAGPLESHE